MTTTNRTIVARAFFRALDPDTTQEADTMKTTTQEQTSRYPDLERIEAQTLARERERIAADRAQMDALVSKLAYPLPAPPPGRARIAAAADPWAEAVAPEAMRLMAAEDKAPAGWRDLEPGVRGLLVGVVLYLLKIAPRDAARIGERRATIASVAGSALHALAHGEVHAGLTSDQTRFLEHFVLADPSDRLPWRDVAAALRREHREDLRPVIARLDRDGNPLERIAAAIRSAVETVTTRWAKGRG